MSWRIKVTVAVQILHFYIHIFRSPHIITNMWFSYFQKNIKFFSFLRTLSLFAVVCLIPIMAHAGDLPSSRAQARTMVVDQALDQYERSQDMPSAPLKPVYQYTDQVSPTGYQTAAPFQKPRASSARPRQIIKDPPLDRTTLPSTSTLSMGYRRDQLDWNLAGNLQGQNPNVAFEMTWEDLEIYQIKSQNRIQLDGPFSIDASVAFGLIQDGQSQESEFSMDNRQNEFLRSLSRSDDGYTLDLSLGLGYTLFLVKDADFWELDQIGLTLLGGYSGHVQSLTRTDGVQTIDTNDFYGLGSFAGLDSGYDTRWIGPWLGLELFGKKDKYFSNIRLDYHWADYDAEGNYNLRNDLNHPKSYSHEAKGKGLVANVVLGMDLNSLWQLSLNTEWQNWSTGDGIDRLYYSDGSTQETVLNEVNYTSFAMMMAATYKFD